jgi:lysophospholipase L1-like esterase
VRAAGVEHLDLWEALAAHADEGLFLAGDPVHFSALGHRVIAEEIRRSAAPPRAEQEALTR